MSMKSKNETRIDLAYELMNCPDIWKRFVKQVNPDGSREHAVDNELKEYNAILNRPCGDLAHVDFETIEDKTRFVLTWS